MSGSKIIVASAGAGKTQEVINKIKENPDKRILVTTYTNNNLDEIKDRLSSVNNKYIDVVTLKVFLLNQCAKPYQNYVIDTNLGRIKSIDFNSKLPLFKLKKDRSYYLNKNNDIYNDRLSDFICEVIEKSNKSVLKRLEKIYDLIIVDEIQDINGRDLDLFEYLLSTKIEIFLVGDHRQSILNTNNSVVGKKGEKGINIINRFKKWEDLGLIDCEFLSVSKRCSQEICDFSDKLFPQIQERTVSQQKNNNDNGIFIIKEDQSSIQNYLNKYPGESVKILRPSKKVSTLGFDSMNIGISKGKTYDRVILFFFKSLDEYLRTGNLEVFTGKKKTYKNLALLYVALTRARYGVLIVSNLNDNEIFFSEIKRFESRVDQFTLF